MSTPDDAFPVLGILGGGQLGKMMAAAAVQMGVAVRLLSPKPAGPMQYYAHAQTADWTDPDVLRAFAADCTAVTVESEWAPAGALDAVRPDTCALWPAPETLALIKDKGVQKQHLAKAGLPVPDFANCPTLNDALDAAQAFGYPVMLKQFRGAYDGYGNATAHTPEDLRAAWPDLAADDGLQVEAFVDFSHELAVQVARRPGGASVTYPVAHTIQRNHKCHAVHVPAPVAPDVAAEAQRVAHAAVDAVDGVGLTAVELFACADGSVLINELAPRPHNTGHYSIEGCHTSQFANHVRAVLDWPLGDPSLRANAAVMVNVLGDRQGTPPRTTGLPDALQQPNVSVHIYGKPDVRPGRKMGHVTAVGADVEALRTAAEASATAIQL
ncbi:5-(carboxyamino)imidazole ribonucleotide synthase [Salisaeta longa]|uniref:5-(carboxyamino)imidazole ribonucleotide synthase n=1 Tax=Salisaeta longa TaxID=503170 RepID=UPI0003B3377D|nr:5-(carboxyamino)imidazole ribonucleotide synthase [Salisaeta longa]